jgi:predicted anti-sigma-YlaC factor YlaD
MKCSEMKEFIFDHVLGELAPEVEIRVNEHLAMCETCRREQHEVDAAFEGFKNAARFEPAPGIYEKITAHMKVPRQRGARLLGIPRNLILALGAFLLGVVITRSIDTVVTRTRGPVRIEVRQEEPRKMPFSDTVEFYSVPAKNLAKI